MNRNEKPALLTWWCSAVKSASCNYVSHRFMYIHRTIILYILLQLVTNRIAFTILEKCTPIFSRKIRSRINHTLHQWISSTSMMDLSSFLRAQFSNRCHFRRSLSHLQESGSLRSSSIQVAFLELKYTLLHYLRRTPVQLARTCLIACVTGFRSRFSLTLMALGPSIDSTSYKKCLNSSSILCLLLPRVGIILICSTMKLERKNCELQQIKSPCIFCKDLKWTFW